MNLFIYSVNGSGFEAPKTFSPSSSSSSSSSSSLLNESKVKTKKTPKTNAKEDEQTSSSKLTPLVGTAAEKQAVFQKKSNFILLMLFYVLSLYTCI